MPDDGNTTQARAWQNCALENSAKQAFHRCQRLVQFARVFAAATRVVRFAAAFSSDNRSDLLDDFASVLATVDALIVTEVYAAGEAPIAGADGKAICRAVRSHGRVEPIFVDKVDQLPQALVQIVRDGDLVVTMGAGSIGAIANELPRTLATLRPEGRQS